MHDFELEQLRRNPAWRNTLKTYWELQTQARQTIPEFDGWVPRVTEVPKVDPALLSNVHGRLIAFGFLKFDLSNREVGMRYQLSPLGRHAIGAASAEDAAELADSVA
uniref:Transcriptional regulator n=1 Tax=Schlesneria paludicola TaxID=360056 RepID=A0A7C4QLW8_9PLAN